MTINPSARVDTLRRKLENGERGLDEADRKALLAFSDRLFLLTTDYTDHRHEKLLRHCVRMSEDAGPLVDVIDDQAASERVVGWINRSYENEETNRDYRSAIRVFGKRVAETIAYEDVATDRRGIPETLTWVPTGTSSSYDPAPDPADMLDWERDVKPMVDSCHNDRDKALISMAFDAGPRSEELQNLTLGDVTDADLGMRVAVDGKTGQRSVTLVPSVPWASDWRFESHPSKNDSDAPLWCKLDDGSKQLSYRGFLDVFKAAAKRAEVSKPVTPTNFRKSNASWLARKGASAHLIEDRQGRERGSQMAARYVARFGDAESARYASLHGMDVEIGDGSSIVPVPCPRCGTENPAGDVSCSDCGQALEPGAAEAVGAAKRHMREAMAASDDAGRRAKLLNVLETLEEDPGAGGRLVELALDHELFSSD